MAILVTGGAGYIGSHTVVALSEAGFEVVVVDNLCNSSQEVLVAVEGLVGGEVPFYEVDIRDKNGLVEVFKNYKFEAVVHFAALKSVSESVEMPELYMDNNVGGTEVLLEVMKEAGVGNIVFSSSCTVYGQPKVIPVDENALILPAESPYGLTKQLCEERIAEFAKGAGESAVALLRYFNPIGAHHTSKIGESPKGVPNNLVPFLCQAVAGIRGELVVFGDDYPTEDGSCVRDYLHVCDLAEAHVAAVKGLRTGECEAYNLGTGRGSSVLELINEFEKSTGKKVPYKIGNRRDGDIVEIYADPSKAENELGWSANRSMGEALRDAWNWTKSNL